MDRESNLNSPRVDEQMKHESRGMLQGRTFDEGREERYQAETPEDPGAGRRPDVPSMGEGMPDEDEVELRAEMAARLRPSAFPGDKASLIAVANEEGTGEDVLGLLAQLPEGQTFETPMAVWEATGGKVEHRDAEGYAR